MEQIFKVIHLPFAIQIKVHLPCNFCPCFQLVFVILPHCHTNPLPTPPPTLLSPLKE